MTPKPKVVWIDGFLKSASTSSTDLSNPFAMLNARFEATNDLPSPGTELVTRRTLAPRSLARHYAGGWSQGSRQNTMKKNWLQTRNYLIYHLANPFQSFSRNILETVHLFGVKIKEHLNNRSTASIFFETRVLLFILRNLRTVFLKWQRDRAGGKPPMTTPDLQSLRPEILRSHSHFEERDSLLLGRLSADR